MSKKTKKFSPGAMTHSSSVSKVKTGIMGELPLAKGALATRGALCQLQVLILSTLGIFRAY